MCDFADSVLHVACSHYCNNPDAAIECNAHAWVPRYVWSGLIWSKLSLQIVTSWQQLTCTSGIATCAWWRTNCVPLFVGFELMSWQHACRLCGKAGTTMSTSSPWTGNFATACTTSGTRRTSLQLSTRMRVKPNSFRSSTWYADSSLTRIQLAQMFDIHVLSASSVQLV